jgi:hypothetical protein
MCNDNEFKTIPNTIFTIELRKKYHDFEEDYQNTDYTAADLKKKYGYNHYRRLYKEYMERGGKTRLPGKYYSFDKSSNQWVIYKRVNGKMRYFGSFETEEEAKVRVKELKENNWNKNKI